MITQRRIRWREINSRYSLFVEGNRYWERAMSHACEFLRTEHEVAFRTFQEHTHKTFTQNLFSPISPISPVHHVCAVQALEDAGPRGSASNREEESALGPTLHTTTSEATTNYLRLCSSYSLTARLCGFTRRILVSFHHVASTPRKA